MRYYSGPNILPGDLVFWSEFAAKTTQGITAYEYVGICVERRVKPRSIQFLSAKTGRLGDLNESYLVAGRKAQ